MGTFWHGRGAYFALDDGAGDLQDLSSCFKGIDLDESVDTADTSAFGTDAKTHEVGMISGKVSLKGMFDATVDAQIAAVLGQATKLDFVFGPSGNVAGRVRYTGHCSVTGHKVAASISDMVSADVDLEIDGRVPPDVFPP